MVASEAGRCSLVVNINSTPKSHQRARSSRCFGFVFVLAFGIVSGGNPGLNLCLLQGAEFSRRSSNEVHSKLWVCVDARVGIRGGKTKLSRGLSESTLARSKNSDAVESNGPM